MTATADTRTKKGFGWSDDKKRGTRDKDRDEDEGQETRDRNESWARMCSVVKHAGQDETASRPDRMQGEESGDGARPGPSTHRLFTFRASGAPESGVQKERKQRTGSEERGARANLQPEAERGRGAVSKHMYMEYSVILHGRSARW